jgi:molecular chaperone GrpE (heat shock protein)
MLKPLASLTLALTLFSISGCQQLKSTWERPAKEMERLQKENRKLTKDVTTLQERIAKSEAEGIMNKVLVSLYDLRHAMEKFAQENEGKYPVADNITDLQTRLNRYLPENFEVEAVYLERVRSQQRGYIMIANVKGREIVVSNLL